MTRNLLTALLLFGLLSCGGTEKETHTSKQTGMCAKEKMAADGIVRLSKIEVYPEFLDEYIKYATEVGEISLRTEPGVLTMYAVGEKENPCKITILETYASRRHTTSTSLPHISGNTSRERCTWSSRWYCQTRRRSIRPTESITLWSNILAT